MEIPIKDNTFDFVYSFGVLHHTPDPERVVREIVRVIKRGASIFLYLYEDHSENPIKYLAIKIITILRKITTRTPREILYAISYLISPFIIVLFSYPSRILKKFKVTEYLADRI